MYLSVPDSVALIEKLSGGVPRQTSIPLTATSYRTLILLVLHQAKTNFGPRPSTHAAVVHLSGRAGGDSFKQPGYFSRLFRRRRVSMTGYKIHILSNRQRHRGLWWPCSCTPQHCPSPVSRAWETLPVYCMIMAPKTSDHYSGPSRTFQTIGWKLSPPVNASF